MYVYQVIVQSTLYNVHVANRSKYFIYMYMTLTLYVYIEMGTWKMEGRGRECRE